MTGLKTPSIDLTGYRCPVPVIRLEAALRRMGCDAQVIVFTDDPVAIIDIPHFCGGAGHAVQIEARDGDRCVFKVTKNAKSA
ncbi:MAG: sulfurtransferase TusA family protein [Marinicaulis sp.]|nr:sulfurtransferase TusA family protein [Marinicaulis sp.]